MNNASSSTASSSSSDTLSAGQTLGVGDKLVSRNGKFALGFFQPSIVISKSGSGTNTSSSSSPPLSTLQNTTITSPNWYLGIWFHDIPVLTTVWVANREDPIVPAQDLNLTRLRISADGNLVIVVSNLTTGHGGNTITQSIIWSTSSMIASNNRSSITTTTATHVVLLNTGNLALIGRRRRRQPSSSSSNNATTTTKLQLLWQSFDYPTDVLLPGAKIGWNKVTGYQTQYISMKNLLDPRPGSYCTALELGGTLVHKGRKNMSSDVYWSWDAAVNSATPKLIPLFDSLIDMNPQTKGLIGLAYVENSEEAYYTYTLRDESRRLFFLQDAFGGQVKLKVWSQAQQSWQTPFAHPASPCTAYATCGPFTLCNGVSYPFCECMQSFSRKSPRDWELGDTTAGCVRDNPLHSCLTSTKTDHESTDVFRPVPRVTLPYNPQILGEATTQSECAEACLRRSCSCTAYSYNSNSSVCSVWHGDLLHVKRNDGLDNTAEDVLYVRVAAKDYSSSLPSPREGKRRRTLGGVGLIAAIIVSCGLVMTIVLLLLLMTIWRKKLIKRFGGGASVHHEGRSSGGGGCSGIVAFRYADLGHATKNFSEQLGAGGFGSVFKGVLNNDSAVAVKRLECEAAAGRQGEKQFRAEVSSLGSIQHINLVKLIGFCCEGDDKRLLVYEHMPNGSLDAHLFESSNDNVAAAVLMNWSTRYQIAVGVARGLSYLHQSCHKCIIHCDIKPENILLDAAFVPKIADFGMSAAVGRDFSRVLTTFRGTVGYLAPEWLSGVAITPKVDAYSFGMVLFEILSGRRNSSPQHQAAASSSGSGSSGRTDDDQHNAAGGYYCSPVQAIRKLHDGDVRSLMDPRLQGDFDLEEAERVCKVACWCIQDDELHRPTMGEVVRVLEGQQTVGMPPMPRLLAALIKPSDL